MTLRIGWVVCSCICRCLAIPDRRGRQPTSFLYNAFVGCQRSNEIKMRTLLIVLIVFTCNLTAFAQKSYDDIIGQCYQIDAKMERFIYQEVMKMNMRFVPPSKFHR